MRFPRNSRRIAIELDSLAPASVRTNGLLPADRVEQCRRYLLYIFVEVAGAPDDHNRNSKINTEREDYLHIVAPSRYKTKLCPTTVELELLVVAHAAP
jgi:hypothetical protein